MEETKKPNLPIKKLYRSRHDRVILGISGGLGVYFEIDSWIIRILFITFTFFSGFGLVLYLILAILIPLERGIKEDSSKQEIDDTIEEINRKRSVKIFLGFAMILVGLVYILKMYFPVHFYYLFNWRILWPYIIIIIGLFVVFRNTNIK
ncbi:MAG TPA: PspC domain-containing protein [bacterium]|jgi:phage shock protein PspC (stress-responsive transcriptional regulator)|nr:PspC domain-containing protein [bacterium]HOG38550.1 PspC domain-containing protein [bacterium]HQI03420.1 PspC domain-containing protein [bacterium]